MSLARRVAALVLVGASAAACSTASVSVRRVAERGIRWEECADRLERTYPGADLDEFTASCGRMEVPRSWDDPDGPTLRLALVRLRAEDQGERIGSLVINPGGPGGSGVDAAVQVLEELPDDVLSRFDLVGFDPRGVGKSTPLVCSLFEMGSYSSFDADDEDLEWLYEETASINEECARRRTDVVPHINTVQTAHDLDAIRAALGDSRLTYLGWSYGTELGATYAQLHPESVRALVLDGAVDVTMSQTDLSRGQAMGFERAFAEMVRRCNADDECPLTGRAEAEFDEVVEALDDDPVDTDEGWFVDGESIQWYTLYALYDDRSWDDWWAVLSALRDGDGEPFDEWMSSFSVVTQYRNLGDAFRAVMCADRPDRPDLTAARRFHADLRAEYPRFGSAIGQSIVNCTGWPEGSTPLVPVEAPTAAPILVVGTVDDPATPYEWSVALADELSTATLLTWRGAGHTAYPKSPCIIAAVDRYLIDLELPAPDASCPA